MLSTRWLPALYIAITALILLMLTDLGRYGVIAVMLLALLGGGLLLEKAQQQPKAAIELALFTFMLLMSISVIADFQILLPQLQLLVGLLAMALLLNSRGRVWMALGGAAAVWAAVNTWVFIQTSYRLERALNVPEDLLAQYTSPLFQHGAMSGLLALGFSIAVSFILLRWIYSAKRQQNLQALIASGVMAAFLPGILADLFTLAGFSPLGFIMIFSPSMAGVFMISGWVALLAFLVLLWWGGKTPLHNQPNNTRES